jgi:ATP synthase protein I
VNNGERGEDPFVTEVRRQAERARRGRELSFWQGLSLVGGIGWVVVLPAVGGAVLGRLLDAQWGTGHFWTLSLLTVGLTLGCVSAWRQIARELHD